jgi:hypothetical protein
MKPLGISTIFHFRKSTNKTMAIFQFARFFFCYQRVPSGNQRWKIPEKNGGKSMDINGGCSTLAGWRMNIPNFGITAVLPMGFISGSMK